jgi:hypothetical protein
MAFVRCYGEGLAADLVVLKRLEGLFIRKALFPAVVFVVLTS